MILLERDFYALPLRTVRVAVTPAARAAHEASIDAALAGFRSTYDRQPRKIFVGGDAPAR